MKGYITTNFRWDEFIHPTHQKYVTQEIEDRIVALANRLQVIRDLTGKSIIITSGFRPSEYNDQLPNSTKANPKLPLVPGNGSYHIYGMAVDVVMPHMDAPTLQKFLQDWSGGMGCYKTYTHLDIGPKRRWS